MVSILENWREINNEEWLWSIEAVLIVDKNEDEIELLIELKVLCKYPAEVSFVVVVLPAIKTRGIPISQRSLQVMAATSASTGEVYPPDIQQLLTKYSKYHDVGSLAFAAYLIPQAEITEQNREAFRKELSLMKELYSKLVIQRDTSNMEIKTLSEREMSSCEELAKKVPNIKEIPQYFGFTFHQKMMIDSALVQAERRKKIAIADPTIANQLKVLLAKIEPLELARILNV
ncbi:hypothetical protein MKW98_026717 [Papaver atlanticum]|uniref:Uncharacterized protein n=1 Tax=Papaver atlanticum TaxID=357466 RepID=A0AAD4RZQ7_9MAGN|nr:hypothetical protein MKW98_026717 [Papaver atlanticum]